MVTLIRVVFLILFGTSALFAYAQEAGGYEKKYELSICSLIQNEAKFLKEWIEYHRLVGVDHFYLFDAQSSDHSMAQLDPYVSQGIVTLIPWPALSDVEEEASDIAWALGIKIPSFEYATKFLAIRETAWITFLDVSEYLLPVDQRPFSTLLKRYREYPGVELEVVYFDASRLDPIPPRELVIQTNLLSNPSSLNLFQSVVKMIVQPEKCEGFQWPPYRVIFKDGEQPLTLSKSIARVNSYRNCFNGQLAKEVYHQRMNIRGLEMSEGEIDKLLSLGYEIEDPSCLIFNYVPKLLEKMKVIYERN